MQGLEEEREAFLLAFEFSIHLARHPELQKRFRGNARALQAWMARSLEAHAVERGGTLPLPAGELAAGLTALGQGIALARLSDPDSVPDDLFGKMLTLILGDEGGTRAKRRR